MRKTLWAVFSASLSIVACGDDEGDHVDSGHAHDGQEHEDAGSEPELSFFVTSDTSKTGNLGGLSAADARCNKLAMAAGSKRKFAAYLSTEKNAKGENTPVHARDRIGKGPWYNAKGVILAKDVDALHALPGGDAELFLTETGEKINGQWEGSPKEVEHDILTGSSAEGRVVAGKTCADWTSADMALKAQVGHSDGLGPGGNAAAPFSSWNSSHENRGCDDTAPAGGAGRIYCFAAD